MAMTSLPEPSTLNEVEVALEASCGALITLERLNSGLAHEVAPAEGVHAHLAQAIQSLRNAIDELRHAQSTGTSGLTMGFVLARPHPAPPSERS